MPDPKTETPGKETPGKVTPPVSGEPGKETPPDPGAEGKETAEFLEIEGMGQVKVEDVKALKTAQTGLEKERNDLKTKVADLEKTIQEAQNKGLSEEEKFRKELAEERKSLLDDKISLELEKAGITVDRAALNLGVEKVSEVSAAVARFAEKYPGLVKKEVPGNPSPPAPAGGSPGETPPALDKEKEWLARLKAAEKAQDLGEVKKIQAEIDAHRGRETSDKGASTL